MAASDAADVLGTGNMAKVREETMSKPSPSEGAKPEDRPKPGRSRAVASFLGNMLQTTRYKPTQGKNARLWTAVGLAFVIGAGLYTLNQFSLTDYSRATGFTVLAVLALLAGWVIWRIVEHPPFADFLIATEAEMNKVSWTTWDDLKRSTAVVLMTVLIISLFLLGVDVVWSNLLSLLGVLKFDGGGAFGSQAG